MKDGMEWRRCGVDRWWCVMRIRLWSRRRKLDLFLHGTARDGSGKVMVMAMTVRAVVILMVHEGIVRVGGRR